MLNTSTNTSKRTSFSGNIYVASVCSPISFWATQPCNIWTVSAMKERSIKSLLVQVFRVTRAGDGVSGCHPPVRKRLCWVVRVKFGTMPPAGSSTQKVQPLSPQRKMRFYFLFKSWEIVILFVKLFLIGLGNLECPKSLSLSLSLLYFSKLTGCFKGAWWSTNSLTGLPQM